VDKVSGTNTKIFILTGNQGSGKTTFIKNLLELIGDSYTTGGILSFGTWENNKRSSFYLKDLMTGKSELLCDTNNSANSIPFRHFFFKPTGFNFGRLAIENALHTGTNILVVDEIGPLEMEGKGWASSVNKILHSSCKVIILTIRRSLVKDIIARWSLFNAEIVDVESNQLKFLVKQIRDALND